MPKIAANRTWIFGSMARRLSSLNLPSKSLWKGSFYLFILNPCSRNYKIDNWKILFLSYVIQMWSSLALYFSYISLFMISFASVSIIYQEFFYVKKIVLCYNFGSLMLFEYEIIMCFSFVILTFLWLV